MVPCYPSPTCRIRGRVPLMLTRRSAVPVVRTDRSRRRRARLRPPNSRRTHARVIEPQRRSGGGRIARRASPASEPAGRAPRCADAAVVGRGRRHGVVVDSRCAGDRRGCAACAPGTGWTLAPEPAGCAALRGLLPARVAARRCVSTPRPRVAPGLVQYRWRLPEGSPARALFALCVSLLPGTLVANLGGQALLIHALDTGAPVATELAALEDAVAGLFSLTLPAAAPGHG